MLRRAVSRKFGGADVGHIDKTAFHIALDEKISPKSHVQTNFRTDAVTRKMVCVVAFVLRHRVGTNSVTSGSKLISSLVKSWLKTLLFGFTLEQISDRGLGRREICGRQRPTSNRLPREL